jgi:serine/threonine protein kinase
MHSLSILHRDIKPENIMFSPTFDKYVFIDFGISEYRNEPQGQLSFTGFGGTHAYCMSEMKKLFKSQSDGWVNLYTNDEYGLD